jgi:hypothetical protein
MALFSRSRKRVVLPEFDHTVNLTPAQLDALDRPRKLRQLLLLTVALFLFIALAWFALSAFAAMF